MLPTKNYYIVLHKERKSEERRKEKEREREREREREKETERQRDCCLTSFKKKQH